MARKPVKGAAAIEAPPIHVAVIMEPTEHEGGSDGGSFGDVIVTGSTGPGNQSRYTVAQLLRSMADHIANTKGDPMIGGTVTVLMRRPR